MQNLDIKTKTPALVIHAYLCLKKKDFFWKEEQFIG